MIKQLNGKNHLFDFNYCFYSCDEYIKIDTNDMMIWNNKGYYLKHQYDLDQFININHNYKKSK